MTTDELYRKLDDGIIELMNYSNDSGTFKINHELFLLRIKLIGEFFEINVKGYIEYIEGLKKDHGEFFEHWDNGYNIGFLIDRDILYPTIKNYYNI